MNTKLIDLIGCWSASLMMTVSNIFGFTSIEWYYVAAPVAVIHICIGAGVALKVWSS